MKKFNLERTLYKAGKCLKKNSPTILSCIATVGVVTSTVLAVRATPKALKALEDATNDKGEELTKFETVRVAIPIYIPTVVTCASTIMCIFGANALNKKQQASLISAYALLDDTFKKYRKAANDAFGEDADSKIISQIAKRVWISPNGCNVYDPDMDYEGDKFLFYDFVSQRYFNATLNAVLNAEYHINRNLQLRGEVSINEFYEFVGIPSVENGDNIGWNMDYMLTAIGSTWLDFDNDHTKLDDGMECCIVSPFIEPLPFSVIEEEMTD